MRATVQWRAAGDADADNLAAHIVAIQRRPAGPGGTRRARQPRLRLVRFNELGIPPTLQPRLIPCTPPPPTCLPPSISLLSSPRLCAHLKHLEQLLDELQAGQHRDDVAAHAGEQILLLVKLRQDLRTVDERFVGWCRRRRRVGRVR